MTLVSGKKILKHARENKYAIPAFGFVNLEGAKAIIQAAEDMNSPVILQTTGGGIKYGGHEELAAISIALAKKTFVPVALHLDHGKNLEIVKKSIALGYTSIMYDGSEEKIEINIKNSLYAKKLIGKKNISLETELGLIGGKEDDINNEQKADFTTPEEAFNFAYKVKPEALAIACGTAHGKYSKPVDIKFNLIKKISSQLKDISIVLHGSSWVPLEQVTKAVKAGITKVNFDSELKQAYIDSVMKYMKIHPKEYDLRKILLPAIQSQKEIAISKIKSCRSQNKNWLSKGKK